MQPHIQTTTVRGTVLVSEPPHILVRVDDPGLRARVTDALAGDGHAVGHAANGMDLLQRVAESRDDGESHPRHDVVVLSFEGPDPAALDLLSSLRHLDPRLPIVVLLPEMEHAAELALTVGASAVFDERVDVDDLRTAVLHLASAGSRLSAVGARPQRESRRPPAAPH